MLKVKNLYYKSKGFILENISFVVEKGEYSVLLGPSGSGKTTLIECIVGLRKNISGSVYIDDRDVTSLMPELRRIGYLPQDYLLFPHLSVKENILFGLRIRNISDDELKSRFDEISETLHIKDILERDVSSLSGGQMQRVALARALIIHPSVMILDEPFSSVDTGLKLKLWFDIKEIFKKLNIPVIHITHDIEEAAAVGDKIVVLIHGRIDKIGTATEIFQKPETESIARYLGISNIFSGSVISSEPEEAKIEVDGVVFTVNNQGPKLDIGETVKICIRPQDIKIIREGEPLKDELKNNVFKGKIISECFYEDSCGLRVNTAPPLELKFPLYIYKRYNLYLGKEITVSIWQPSICVFKSQDKK